MLSSMQVYIERPAIYRSRNSIDCCLRWLLLFNETGHAKISHLDCSSCRAS